MQKKEAEDNEKRFVVHDLRRVSPGMDHCLPEKNYQPLNLKPIVYGWKFKSFLNIDLGL